MTTIGIPKEIKSQEYRVGLTPSAVASLVAKGHQVMVETGAGLGAGYDDRAYEQAGARLTATPQTIYQQALILKVKEPQPTEYEYLQPDSILFTYLHLAADEGLTKALMQSQACCIGYETVQTETGQLPLLAPMSRIAGRLATQYGAHFLTKHQGGRGVLLGGIAGVPAGRVVILGGGVVGTESAKVAIGMGAQVTILDVNLSRLAELETILQGRAQLLYSHPDQIAEAVTQADLVIGAVLVPGAKAPLLIPKSLIAQMRPYSVLIDVAVDQGGCIETIRPTSHDQPTYLLENVLHCGIPNLPGAVARSATQALVNATFPFVLSLAEQGRTAIEQNPALAKGVNVDRGRLIHPQVRQAFPHLS
jgi:alanine dehydrogenase